MKTKLIKWRRPSGTILEASGEEASIEQCEKLGYVRLDDDGMPTKPEEAIPEAPLELTYEQKMEMCRDLGFVRPEEQEGSGVGSSSPGPEASTDEKPLEASDSENKEPLAGALSGEGQKQPEDK